jgi:hypothetical protein
LKLKNVYYTEAETGFRMEVKTETSFLVMHNYAVLMEAQDGMETKF